MSDAQSTPRLIAFYLPQFHPVPENDEWWGKGFTEWTNVTKAQPLFHGHYQPHLPSDFGFYDLRVRETRREQIAVAKEYGIDGFCYHFYWFSGRRILERPVEDMLDDAESDMPFCLCWANESWTRRWDAADHEVLLQQQYLPSDDLDFIKAIEPYFRDPRYIKVDGKPLLIVYRAQELPDAQRSAGVWRDYCRAAGIGEIHLCAALTHGNLDYRQFGFDSGVEFPPHNLAVTNVNQQLSFHGPFQGNVMQYAEVARSFLSRSYAGEHVFKTVFPSWDNTARTANRATLALNGTPENYEYWLSEAIDLTRRTAKGEPLVFINAWNEWAEGCHLEPDRRYGRAFLEATRNAKRGLRRFQDFTHTGVPADGTAAPRRFWPEFSELLRYHLSLRFGNLKLAINRHPWLRNALLPLVRGVRKLVNRS
jgi:hypothetical protein